MLDKLVEYFIGFAITIEMLTIELFTESPICSLFLLFLYYILSLTNISYAIEYMQSDASQYNQSTIIKSNEPRRESEKTTSRVQLLNKLELQTSINLLASSCVIFFFPVKCDLKFDVAIINLRAS